MTLSQLLFKALAALVLAWHLPSSCQVPTCLLTPVLAQKPRATNLFFRSVPFVHRLCSHPIGVSLCLSVFTCFLLSARHQQGLAECSCAQRSAHPHCLHSCVAAGTPEVLREQQSALLPAVLSVGGTSLLTSDTHAHQARGLNSW